MSPDTPSEKAETRCDCTCSPSAFTGYYTPANDCPAHGPASAPPASEGEARALLMNAKVYWRGEADQAEEGGEDA